MTFSLLGRSAETGALGACTATSDVAVGARVSHAEAGVGAVLTQHRTDPRLGPRGLTLLRSGCNATETVAALVASTPHRDWRQLAVLDAGGGTASYSGGRVADRYADDHGPGCVALGNVLAADAVVPAMVRAFVRNPDEPLAERLMEALEAGLATGGELSPCRSAALLVVSHPGFALVDLRVDLDADPVARLRDLWDAYRPVADEFVLRALDPDRAPGATGAGSRRG
jgi:uncharacterized Ntn-hydrolase superfamily protein